MKQGKRDRAVGYFYNETNAKSACSLNNQPLDILGKGKVTIRLVYSAKIRISTEIYQFLATMIDNESKIWKKQHLFFQVYEDNMERFTTLRIEGEDAKAMANARKTPEDSLLGSVVAEENVAIWSPAYGMNGSAYKKLQMIEQELEVRIIRSKSERQLRYFGPPEKFQDSIRRIKICIKEEPSNSFEIDLAPIQFAWALQGGFKIIHQSVGENVAVFNMVSKQITVNGTRQQCEIVLALLETNQTIKDQHTLGESGCPACLSEEAENHIQTSCKHTYCLDCFEEYCKSVASNSKNSFKVSCLASEGNCLASEGNCLASEGNCLASEGNCLASEGNCPAMFTLRELNSLLPSSVFETVLRSSFEEHVQRHPETLHYCPTPNCGYVYRCSAAIDGGVQTSSYSCPNCPELTCTSCHAQHGNYACAEYRDIASGGYEALEKLKKVCNIKDCPKCKTLIEKDKGCNHITCGGCKAHICWACLELFDSSDPCYTHMSNVHGGLGLESQLELQEDDYMGENE